MKCLRTADRCAAGTTKPPKIKVSRLTLKRKTNKRDDSVLEKTNRPLVEKLLAEITGKYTVAQIKDSCYLARLEKKSMIQEIKMLASALVSSEQSLKRVQDAARAKLKDVRLQLEHRES